MRWLVMLLVGLGGCVAAELSKPWMLRTFEVEHPGVIALPAVLGAVVLWKVGEAVVAGVRAYRAPR